ncbi:MAG: peptide chain release factor N(5)-glutamine methyltransferase [Flavobacteriaceae bacterium]|nr:peptide chain release factor N(5)-glutamine methyltransferase [Flavobacteriaceae bacterium]
MTIQELKSTFLKDLAQLYPKEEIQSFFNLLISFKLKLTRADIALNPNQIILQKDLDFFLNAIADLYKEKPIQYIIGETEFYGLPFKVNKNVLIPRSETEELVTWILNETKKKRPKTQDPRLTILDIGTGNGCIAISLAKNLPDATVFALDISKGALKIAQQNAKLNSVDINFVEQNILNTNVMLSGVEAFRTGLVESYESEKLLSLKFDIIVSNPPYVRELEKKEIQNNVLENEPHIALFVDDNNPLLFYDKIANFAKKNLNKSGQLYFEINQYLGKEAVELLKQKGFTDIELRKDILGNDRMIKVSF